MRSRPGSRCLAARRAPLLDGRARGFYRGGADPGEPVSPPGATTRAIALVQSAQILGQMVGPAFGGTHGRSLWDSRCLFWLEWSGRRGRLQYAPDVSGVPGLYATAAPAARLAGPR